MKVPGSVRDAYAWCSERSEGLQARVDALVLGRKRPRWHYESRLKELVSFAQKVETGRVADPLALEDFFACTLVVENHRMVAEARRLVESIFDVREVRPPQPGRTSKQPSDFPFDDLRMYVRWRADPSEPPVPFSDLTFEVQVKTFLQHAWAIATHDLVYKTDRASWPLQRVAYQIKAMLEHAEVSILRAEDLAETEILNLQNKEHEHLEQIIEFLERHWDAASLPPNRVLLARTIASLLARLGVDVEALEATLSAETALGRGASTLNLSPYGILVQSLLNQRPDAFDRLTGTGKPAAFRIFLPREIEGREAISAKAPAAVVTL